MQIHNPYSWDRKTEGFELLKTAFPIQNSICMHWNILDLWVFLRSIQVLLLAPTELRFDIMLLAGPLLGLKSDL